MAKKEKKSEITESRKRIESLKTEIRRILMNAGKYKKEMTKQVELTATTLLIFRKICDEILEKDAPPIIEEKSREGDCRKKENPIYTMYREFARELRHDLRALKMNQELERKGTEDEQGEEKSALVALMKNLDEEDKEE